jgi:peroxidase
VIDEAKAAIEAACPNVVSCADVVAFAARDASRVLSRGRVNIRVAAGRLDGRESFANETVQLPGPFLNVTGLQRSFGDQGLSLDDMVTLSGAHTVGRGRCAFFSARLGDMDPALAAKLRAQCNGDDNNFVNQDDVTPNVLDKQYYRNVIDRKVLFNSDAALNSTDTVAQVTQNANGKGAWERKFEQAMEKMGSTGVTTRPGQGFEIRKVCSRVN